MLLRADFQYMKAKCPISDLIKIPQVVLKLQTDMMKLLGAFLQLCCG
jgi:hypothetical protein